MQLKRLRLRFRRQLRVSQKQAGEFGTQAERDIERYLFRRFDRIAPVRRFVGAWVGLLVLLLIGVLLQNAALSGYFQSVRPVAGGIYREGSFGRFSTANPIYAVNGVDVTVSRLVFAGLFTHDDQGQLVGELASSYSADQFGSTYTVHLKPNLKWQDGKPLTSADVVFTYQLIQNPDTQSPLQNSWRGIMVTAPDAHTVVFSLPDPLASFPHSLTTGIVPKHLLASIPTNELRTADFNTAHPIGAGPFSWQAIQVSGNDPASAQERIALKPFNDYANGKPKLQEFIIQAYADRTQLAQAFKAGQLNGAIGLETVPPSIKKQAGVQVHSLLQRAAAMVFLKTSEGVLSDAQVRAALVQATDRSSIIKSLGYETHAVREPFLVGQLGYEPALAQADFNRAAAAKILDADGWAMGKHGTRTKNNQPLAFTLYAADSPEYASVAKQLIRQWQAVGVNAKLQLQQSTDFQTTLSYHGYDAVLYGITIGNDPDVYVYWDSSQADIRSANRLNLSEYKNPTADTSLEAGRTRLDPAIRTIKYKPFLQAWQQDNPAIGLYQPRLLYLTHGPVAGLNDHPVTTEIDRFSNIQNWQIRQAKVTD